MLLYIIIFCFIKKIWSLLRRGFTADLSMNNWNKTERQKNRTVSHTHEQLVCVSVSWITHYRLKRLFALQDAFFIYIYNHSVVTERVKKSYKKKCYVGVVETLRRLESPELQMNRTSSTHSLTPVAIETLHAVVIQRVKGLANWWTMVESRCDTSSMHSNEEIFKYKAVDSTRFHII